MGFDVTFHPISLKELKYFFFDVLEDPGIAAGRAAEITRVPRLQRNALKVYKMLPVLVRERDPLPSFGLCAAVVAGFLHPFWYARGQGFSLLPPDQVPEAPALFVSLDKLGSTTLNGLPNPSHGGFLGNESGSGWIPDDRIAAAERLLESLKTRLGSDGLPIIRTAFDEDGLESLGAALGYCRSKQLGLIEAADVVVPISNRCVTDESNLRAPFLRNVDR